MARDCCKVFGFERGGFVAKLADEALAGMRRFWGWTSVRKERYVLFL